jgi:hypothetical protein
MAVRLEWCEHAEGARLRVLGLPPEVLETHEVAVAPASLAGALTSMTAVQPLAGRFEVDGEALCFAPRFPFAPGVEYALLLRDVSGGWGTAATITGPTPERAPAEVTAIYPSAASLPVNLLRMYVHFSRRVRDGQQARAVSVSLLESGAPLEGVFLPELELWDREHQRLTLLLDPGRIKRGLLPHEQLGYPLVEGARVRVRIDGFVDAEGRPAGTAERVFEVGSALHRRVDPRDWGVEAPGTGTREALALRFDRPLDHGILEHALVVRGPEGETVEGEVDIASEERGWELRPAAPWAAGAHTIEVDPRLEDVAGNSLRRVFDRDLRENADAEPVPNRLTFVCAPRRSNGA